jgi:XTP/dITP diphosphohydrolase
MLDIVIATGNRHKFRELTGLLHMPGIRWHSLAEFPRLPVLHERGTTFDANAISKARQVSRAAKLMALADDSGLEVDALNGRPGIRSARFAGRHGDDTANNVKLLAAMEGVPYRRRGARYRCSLALVQGTQVVALTRGTWAGRIATAPRGRGGFGYDPLVIVPKFGKTVAQLPPGVKRRHSHRAEAARRMRRALEQLITAAGRRGFAGSRRVRVPAAG